jgi:hypothetical protein
MSIPKSVNTLKELQAYREQVRREMEGVRMAAGQEIEDIFSRKNLVKIGLGAAAIGIASALARRYTDTRLMRAYGMGAAEGDSAARWLPVLRRALDYALDYLESRWMEKKAEE